MSTGRFLELDVGRTVPGWAVRLAVPVVAVAAEALVAPAHLPGRVRLVWFGVSAVLLARTPAGLVAPTLVLLAGLAQLTHPVSVGWRTSLVVLLLHGLLALAALAGYVAWRARVELAVLRGTILDALPAQVVAQVLVLALVPFGAAGTSHPWIRLVAVAAALGVALLVHGLLAPARPGRAR